MNLCNYFDQIYIIHLDELHDRKLSIIEQIQSLNLTNITIIDAINKNILDNDKMKENDIVAYPGNKYCREDIINDKGDKCWCKGRGHADIVNKTGIIACAYGHFLIYYDMLEKGYSRCLVLEDDFIFVQNMDTLFQEIMPHIPEDWELLYLGNAHKIKPEFANYNSMFVKTHRGITDTGCYGITQESAKTLYENFFPIRAGSDGYLGVCIDRLYKINNVYICKRSISKNGSVNKFKSVNNNVTIDQESDEETRNLLYSLVKNVNKINLETIYNKEEMMKLKLKTPPSSQTKPKIVETPKTNNKINVLSFCLYGSKATYIKGMEENIKLAKVHFPDWQVRIYYNETVPDKYIKIYQSMGANMVKCVNLGINKMNWEGMFWRWLPLDDKNVKFWVSRDADSRLSKREADIVKQWMDSGKTLHCIRDHRCHMHCIMGGLFGINNETFHNQYKFKEVTQIIRELYGYYKERPYNVDQIFLNDQLWYLLKNDVIAHISNNGRKVNDDDISIPSDPQFIGKQYRLQDDLVDEAPKINHVDLNPNMKFKIKSKYGKNYMKVENMQIRIRDESTDLWKMENGVITHIETGLFLSFDNKNDIVISNSKTSWRIQEGGFVMNVNKNMSIDVKGGLPDKRKEVWLYKSNYSEAQQWDFVLEDNNDSIQIQLKNQNKYIDFDNNKVKISPIERSVNICWSYKNKQFFNESVKKYLSCDKNDLILTDKPNETSQWLWETDTIMNEKTKMVIDVKGGVNDQRNEIWLYMNNNSPAQKWVTSTKTSTYINSVVSQKYQKKGEKMLLILNHQYHHKNKKGMEMICQYLNYDLVYGTIDDIEDADVVFCPSQPFDVRKYPNKRFVFGPHLSIFPDAKIQRIHNQKNSVYIQPSPWAKEVWVNMNAEKIIPVESFPFPVEIEKFKPPANKGNNIFVMFKQRDPNELAFIENYLKNKDIAFRTFRYGSYKEDDYLKYLQTCSHGIWLGRHESQGFALQEALSCDIPLCVWSVKNMQQQHGWKGCPDVPGTTIPFWDDRCGVFFENQEDFESKYLEFLSKMDEFKPREFICDNVSVKQCADNFKRVFLNMSENVESITPINDNVLRIQHGGKAVAPGSGFFSCCSVKLFYLIQYFNKHKKCPENIDCSEQFLLYKNKENENQDITYDFFEHYDKKNSIPYEDFIKFHFHDQFKPYKTLDFESLTPFIEKYFSLSENIKTLVSELETKYSLDYENTIVLFYRGNDKKTETSLKSYEEVIEKGKSLKNENPNAKVLIQSDELEFVEAATKAFEHVIVFKDEIRTMKKCNNSVDKCMPNNHYYVKYFLAIVKIMSQCKYVVSGSMGNIPMFISLYRGNANNMY